MTQTKKKKNKKKIILCCIALTICNQFMNGKIQKNRFDKLIGQDWDIEYRWKLNQYDKKIQISFKLNYKRQNNLYDYFHNFPCRRQKFYPHKMHHFLVSIVICHMILLI